jgi:proteasome accessory factor A
MNRIVGLETEYGCLANDLPGVPSAVTRVRDWVFAKQRFGLIDIHQRDWDEPAGNGGFLFNGGRVYVDMGHLEYCTPECLSLVDVLRYDRAGDAMVLQATRELGIADQVSFIRNNIDHYSGATFGCHENYLVRRAAPLTEENVLSLLAFLTVRVLYAGAGRVGSTHASEMRGDLTRPSEQNIFQLSQRADYINNDLFEWVQFNRAIINTRDEPLADSRRYRRLHLLHGDANVLADALLLKTGTTSLVLDLLEIDHLPKLALVDAVHVFRALSHQLDGAWTVELADGRKIDAVEMLTLYCDAATAEFRGRDTETDFLLARWKDTLVQLAKAPENLVGRVDWITKRWLLEQFRAQEDLSWDDPWLKSQDLEYHAVDPSRSLGLALAKPPSEWDPVPESIVAAMSRPPNDSRAAARSGLMRELQRRTASYYLDWEIIGTEGGNPLQLLNPFESKPSEAEAWLNGLEKGPTRRGT